MHLSQKLHACSTTHLPRRLGIMLLLAAISSMAGAQSATLRPDRNTGTLSPEELVVWNSAGFRRAFIESYLAETDIEPEVTIDERESMQAVLELVAQNRLNEAIASLENTVRTNPHASATIDFTLANLYFQQERHAVAALAYEAAVRKFPKFRRAWKNLALIHVRQGEFQKGAVCLRKVLELGGADALTYGLLGFASSSLDDHLAAETAFRQAVLLDPATLDWQMGLARSLFKQERYPEAAVLVARLIEKNPESADLWLLQANAYIGMNQPLEAIESFEIVDAMGESTPDSLSMLGDIYINEELYDLAALSYQRALEKQPDSNPERPIRSARILASRGAYSETRQMVEAIDQQFKDSLSDAQKKELLKLRTRLAVAEGKADEEVSILEEIVALDPLDGEALILLGQHASRNGEIEQAILHYERAAALEAFEADAKVRHAQLLVQTGDYEKALPLLRRAQQIKPRDNIQEFLEQVQRVARTQ